MIIYFVISFFVMVIASVTSSLIYDFFKKYKIVIVKRSTQ